MAREAIDPERLPEATRIAFRAGDPAAFEAVLNRCQTPLYRMALRMVGDGSAAEDLVQEALLRAYRKRAFYDPARPLEPWLYRTAMNVFMNAAATSRSRRATSLDGLSAPPAAPIDDTAGEADDAERVRRLLPELTPEQRAVLALRYTEDLPVETIAEILGRPVGTVKTHLFRARAFLRERLEERRGDAS